LVNDRGLPRHSDFKRLFEDDGTPGSPNPAALCLTQTAAMLINSALRREGTSVRIFVTTSLILVSRRTAEGG
jgi:hypothetical protein